MKKLLSSSWLGAGRSVSRWSLILPAFHGGGDTVPWELSDSGTWGRIPWGGLGRGSFLCGPFLCAGPLESIVPVCFLHAS